MITLIRNIKKILIKVLVDHGFMLVVFHSIVYGLFRYKLLRLLAILVWRLELVIFSCHISPRCKVPISTIFPHPVGVVIGDGVRIGENVTIYQGVTLGLRNRKSNNYPIIGANVTIYTGAVIIGDVEIADDSIVGANEIIKG